MILDYYKKTLFIYNIFFLYCYCIWNKVRFRN